MDEKLHKQYQQTISIQTEIEEFTIHFDDILNADWYKRSDITRFVDFIFHFVLEFKKKTLKFSASNEI